MADRVGQQLGNYRLTLSTLSDWNNRIVSFQMS